MKHLLIFIYTANLLWLTSACARDNRSSDPKSESTRDSTQSPESELSSPEQEVVVTLTSGPGNCNKSHGFKECKLTKTRLAQRSPMPSSAGQRILILDELFIPSSAYTRFSNRIYASYYLANPDTGDIRSWEPEADVPELLLAAFQKISPEGSIADFQTVAKDLNKLSFQVSTTNYPKSAGVAHNDPIFNWIAEFNPTSEIVLAEFPVPSQQIVCGLDTAQGRSQFAKFFETSGDQVRSIVKNQSIDFVNLSMVPTEATLAQFYSQTCHKNYYAISEGNRGMIQLYRALFLKRILDGNPGTLVVHAAPNESRDFLESDDIRAPFVCNDIDQAVTVGFFTKLNAGINDNGVAIDESLMHETQKNSGNCTSLYVNGGMTEATDPTAMVPDRYDSNSLFTIYGGALMNPEPIMATSWATPLALSMMAKWKMDAQKTGYLLSPQELKNKALGRMWDPLATHTLQKTYYSGNSNLSHFTN